MEIEKANETTGRENQSATLKDANLIVKPEVAKKIKITTDPTNNDWKYLSSLQLRIEGRHEDEGEKQGLYFKIESLNPELNLSFRLKSSAMERVISANIDTELRELLVEENFVLGPGTPEVKAFLDGIGLGIRKDHVEVQREEPTLIKEVKDKDPEDKKGPFIPEGAKDVVVLRCYQPRGTLQPVYGAWCLACCAICPLPTGLTYTHLKSYVNTPLL